MSNPSLFFASPTTQSQVKAEIVAKYFWSWATILVKHRKDRRIAYLDLFAGPGAYNDGTASTPLKVLERTIADPALAKALLCYFSDINKGDLAKLEMTARALPGYADLANAPQYSCHRVDDRVAEDLESLDLVPTLLFADPFGYKALSLRLISAILRNDASEVIFFFNYSRINAALNNSFMRANVDRLFGKERADALRTRLKERHWSPLQRERLILECMVEALRTAHGFFVRPFRFWNERGTRVSHYLVHVTKHPLGHEVMKSVMYTLSAKSPDGVAFFEHNAGPRPIEIFPEYSIQHLKQELVETFAGRTSTVTAIRRAHHPGRPYVEQNYKTALKELEREGCVAIKPSWTERRPGTLRDTASVTFPASGGSTMFPSGVGGPFSALAMEPSGRLSRPALRLAQSRTSAAEPLMAPGLD
jgi:three-Cys-motif partner protein